MSWSWVIGLTAGAFVALAPAATESAIANGDTRTLSLVHAHTHETITATFKVNGEYDRSVLEKLNWFLRDWRRDEQTNMDPRLFDVVWEVYRESGSQQPIMVMSAYRSPETNAMLRRRSRQVAEHSQHILGHAMDQHYMDVPMSRIRELGMKLQRGGVGFYPTAGSPFVHLDVGGVRHWPRMSYDQLARLFPDGKTVHIPSNGVPLPGYEQARAELEARGDSAYPTASQLKSKGFFAWLFGGGGSDEDDDAAAAGMKHYRGSQSRVASAVPDSTVVYNTGKNASDGRSPYAYLNNAPQRPAFSPPPAPVKPPAPEVQEAAPAAPAVVPHEPPTEDQAVALAVPAVENPETGNQPQIRNLPVLSASPMPLPPRRPVELAATGPAAPLPPLRPSELTTKGITAVPHDGTPGASVVRKGDSIGALIASNRIGHLPDVITLGTGPAKTAPRALGYTALAVLSDQSRGSDGGAVPMPVARPAALMSTHLDRSNFRSLTRPEPTDKTTGRSALGAAVPPLRAAARGDLGALAPAPSARVQTFQSRPLDLTTDRFSGTVAKPLSPATEPQKTILN